VAAGGRPSGALDSSECRRPATRTAWSASAVYFTLYYAGGALAGFVPGLAWQAWEWPGVAGLALAALGIGLAGLARPVRSVVATP